MSQSCTNETREKHCTPLSGLIYQVPPYVTGPAEFVVNKSTSTRLAFFVFKCCTQPE